MELQIVVWMIFRVADQGSKDHAYQADSASCKEHGIIPAVLKDESSHNGPQGHPRSSHHPEISESLPPLFSRYDIPCNSRVGSGRQSPGDPVQEPYQDHEPDRCNKDICIKDQSVNEEGSDENGFTSEVIKA